MSDIAIRVESLSKQYKIGTRQFRHDSLKDLLGHKFNGLFGRNSNFPIRNSQSDYIWALKDVSFDVRRGELLGIIGRNGSGKSTLLKILSRITEPTSGRAQIHGRVGSLLEVGTGFDRELTGRENIYLNGSILGMKKSEIDGKLEAILAFAEVEKFIDTPVKHYSSGMYVRLAFSVAAHLQPEILMIDEVLSVGDLKFQQKCMAYAKRLKEQGATVLVVSHNMFAVKAMCNRVIYLSDGQVRANGSPEEAIGLYEQESRLSDAPWASGLASPDPSRRMIRITDISTYDVKGRPRNVFEYGERMRIKLTFEAQETIRAPNFGVSFIRSDNVPCCNFNTTMDAFSISSVEGRGALELVTPPLKLVSELYAIHVMVYDADFQTLHSAQVGTTFHVRHELLNAHFGVFHEPASWAWATTDNDGVVEHKLVKESQS